LDSACFFFFFSLLRVELASFCLLISYFTSLLSLLALVDDSFFARPSLALFKSF